jgi:hypothetical protein
MIGPRICPTLFADVWMKILLPAFSFERKETAESRFGVKYFPIK